MWLEAPVLDSTALTSFSPAWALTQSQSCVSSQHGLGQGCLPTKRKTLQRVTQNTDFMKKKLRKKICKNKMTGRAT